MHYKNVLLKQYSTVHLNEVPQYLLSVQFLSLGT